MLVLAKVSRNIGNYNRENLPDIYKRHTIFILEIKRELIFNYLDVLCVNTNHLSPDNES